jgi:hypothetical protein
MKVTDSENKRDASKDQLLMIPAEKMKHIKTMFLNNSATIA